MVLIQLTNIYKKLKGAVNSIDDNVQTQEIKCILYLLYLYIVANSIVVTFVLIFFLLKVN